MGKQRLNTDSLRGLIGGLGDPLRDKAASVYYSADTLTDDQILAAFRSSWLARAIVTMPADDAVREGRDWQADSEQITAIEAEEKRLGFWRELRNVLLLSRLWGGGAIYIGTGEDPIEPFDPARVKKGGLKYVRALSRKDLSAGTIDQDVMSETYGQPEYYTINGGSGMVKVHPTRLARFIGAVHPDPLTAGGQMAGWGDSVLQPLFTAITNADSAAANIASLIFEANVDVFGIPDFMSSLADPAYEKRVIDRFTLAAAGKSINKSLLRDKEEEYDRKQISFAQLPDLLSGFLQIVSGAAQIPATRLLGRSPAGLNSTGDGDMKVYYDRISAMQALDIGPALYRLDEALIRSALGARPPEVWYDWSSLEQMNDKDMAEIGAKNADTAQKLVQSGLFTADELRKVVTNQLVESGFYPGLDAAVAETDAGGGFDLGTDQPTTDAAPRPLYVRRGVKNAAEIIAWAKAQGFDTTLPADDLHVTLAFSRQPVDWMKCGQPWESEITVPEGGPRLVEEFNGGAIVLLFKASDLEWRHEVIKEAGASWDWPEYHPHITITYQRGGVDLEKVEPYRGKIVLGPEIFEALEDDWKSGITES